MCDVVDLGLVSRLRIPKEDNAEFFGFFLLSARWKVDRLGQRSRRSDTRMLGSFRGTLGLVDVMKLEASLSLVKGTIHPLGLMHKVNDVVRHGQTPMSLGIRIH